MNIKVHPTAIVDPSAKLGENVEIGPYSIVGAHTIIGEKTWVGPHVVIGSDTTIGKDNKIFQFSSVGETPQDLSYKGEVTYLEMGDGNVVRECVTIHKGTAKDKGLTKIGHYNLLMAYAHIAHDCIVHDRTIFLNNASLAGHVEVQNYALIGAFCAVHQFTRVGAYAFVARACMVIHDIPPYLLVAGNVARMSGLNQVGLLRQGFSKNTIRHLWRAYKAIYKEGLLLDEALDKIKTMVGECQEIQRLIDFIEESKKGRGILQVASQKEEGKI